MREYRNTLYIKCVGYDFMIHNILLSFRLEFVEFYFYQQKGKNLLEFRIHHQSHFDVCASLKLIFLLRFHVIIIYRVWDRVLLIKPTTKNKQKRGGDCNVTCYDLNNY